MVIGTMDTEHFTFLVVAETIDKAERLMNKKFKQHLSEYDAPKWNTKEDGKPTEYYAFNCYENVKVGDAFRDYEKL